METAFNAKDFQEYGKNATTDWVLGLIPAAKMLSPLKGKKILDYGCGSGRFARYLRDNGAKVIGTDVSLDMIRIAKEKDSNGIEYFCSPSARIDFIKEESFDAACINFVFGAISKKEEIKSVLMEINRTLKKGGKLIIMNVNFKKFNGKEAISFKIEFNKNLKSGTQMSGVLKSEKLMRGGDYYWSKEDYSKILKEIGFGEIKIMEMIAKDNKHPWIDENKFSPILIISAIKA